MQHRHLLPNEIDLLLDSEVGFGVAPLRDHVDACPECRGRVDDARVVLAALDDLPRFAPSPAFAGRVMAHVQVVEPWHVALVEGARRLVPRHPTLRVVMAASAVVLAAAMSSALVWLAFRTDVAMYLAAQAGAQAQAAVTGALGVLVTDVFGAGAAALLRSQGIAGIGIVVAGFAGAAGAAAVGLRRLAAAARRTRE
ncbi:MAG: hypothetical protein U9Q74_11745 [Gemmatimonadota bacterium]|nr:hypothetical protein [Gemmatimonadota bacterium]